MTLLLTKHVYIVRNNSQNNTGAAHAVDAGTDALHSVRVPATPRQTESQHGQGEKTTKSLIFVFDFNLRFNIALCFRRVSSSIVFITYLSLKFENQLGINVVSFN